MASEEESKVADSASGFAGLSSLVSDVEEVVAHTNHANPRSLGEGEPESTGQGKEAESQPRPDDSQGMSQGLPSEPSGNASGKKWLVVGIVAVVGLLFIIVRSGNRESGQAPLDRPDAQKVPISEAYDRFQTPSALPVAPMPPSNERQSPAESGKNIPARREPRDGARADRGTAVRQEGATLVETVDPQQKVKAFHANLARIVPDYARLNADQGFIQWLSEQDGSSGMTRGDNLNAAYKRLNAESAAYYYIVYKREVSR